MYSFANHPINAALLSFANAPNSDLLLHFDNFIEDSVLVFIEMKGPITSQIIPHLMPSRETQLGLFPQFAKSYLDSTLNKGINCFIVLLDKRLGPYQGVLS